MTLTLHLPPHTEQKLKELAAQTGQDLAGYTLTVIIGYVEACMAHCATDNGDDRLVAAVARMMARTPEQVAQAQSDAAWFIRPGKPLPAGETIFDAVGGKWPGDESDEQVAEALRRLS